MRRRPGSVRLGALLILALLSGLPASAQEQKLRAVDWVRFQTWGADSLALFCSYFSAPASEAPAVLVLHDRGAQGLDFRMLALTLQAEGLPVFLPDLRGEGESIVGRRGNIPAAPAWNAKWRRVMAVDCEAVLGFARRQSGMSERPWLIVAEGEAAGLALDLLLGDGPFRGAVLLSPFPPADLAEDALGTGFPLLLLACDQDPDAVAALRELYAKLPAEARRMELLPCRSRGSRMLNWVDGLDAHISDWCLHRD